MALDIKKFLARFVDEAREHLARLGDGIAALEQGHGDTDSINSLFRSAHTIKGSARMLKLLTISTTAHKLEDILGALRDGSLILSPSVSQMLFRGSDALATLVDTVAAGGTLGEPDTELLAQLEQTATGEITTTLPPPQQLPSAAPVVVSPPLDIISVRPTPNVIPARAIVPAQDIVPVPAALPPPTQPQVSSPLKVLATVRVKLQKLDELIKLMGEVVASHVRLEQRHQEIQRIESRLLALAIPDNLAIVNELQHFAVRLRDDVLDQALYMQDLHDRALALRMLPLTMVLDPAARLVRELAQALGRIVEVKIEGAQIELDRQMIDRLNDPIVHLLRNAVDHGIETAAERCTVGKPAHGRIHIAASQDGGWVTLEVSDDGRGLAVDAIRTKAIKKGIITEHIANNLSASAIGDLIFLPGLSTSQIITDISGRGVGMDVVKKTIVDELRGTIKVDTQPGVGTTFVMRLPLSLAVMRVLLCTVDGLLCGITAQYIHGLFRLAPATFMMVAERPVVTIHNEFIPVVPLAELIDLPSKRYRSPSVEPGTEENLGDFRDRSYQKNPCLSPGNGAGSHAMRGQDFAELALLVVVQVRNEKLALQVDALVDERDLVIKPLPEHMRQCGLVDGVVITGSNELVCILHVPRLVELSRQARKHSIHQAQATSEHSRTHHQILVVDDSLNTREIEKDVLEAHGYAVTLAEDGIDGWQKAQSGDFAAILTDVEMPGLDGFSLTERLRQTQRYAQRPIIIVTSRAKEEDKRRGIAVGADAYIVKGDFEQSSLIDTLANLLV